MPKQCHFPLPYLQPSILCKWLDRDHNGSNSSEVGIWSALAPFGWAATPTAFIRWVHTLINPHWCKKTNKVTLNGKGLLGAARGNGAESALAKASKPFSYWQMKSELLSKICDFPQSPLIRFLSLALPPPFFSYALSEVLSTACSRQKVRFASFPSLPTCRRKMAHRVTLAVLYGSGCP